MSTAVPLRLLPDNASVAGDGSLVIAGCDVASLAREFGTPLFVYDEMHLRARCREAVRAFGPDRVIYATKAFLCTAMARLAHDEGLLLDVATGGELHVALAAGVLHAVRLGGWGPQATLGKPILWILHAGYGWAAIGFLLMAAAALDWVPRALAIHAFSTGTVGGLIIGMVTRTALGHTGRMLIAGKAETTMYALVMLAAVFRVFGPLLFPAAYTIWMTLGAVAWSAGFLLYAVVYAPRLMAPRVDGREG